MTTFPTCTTLYCDDYVSGEADGDIVHLSLYGRTGGVTGEGKAIVGQVILTRKTLIHMLNAVTGSMNASFKKPSRANVVKLLAAAPK